MQKLRSFARVFTPAQALVLAFVAGTAACGEDENVVRTRPDAGAAATLEAGGGTGPGTLGCGVSVPPVYESPNFAANAKDELDLKRHVIELDLKMRTAEADAAGEVSAAELQALFKAGAPNLRSIATAATQAKVDEYITQFGELAVVGGKTWTPGSAEVEGGAPSGGRYNNADIVSAVGLSLREVIAKTLLGGSLYNHALALSTGAVTEATVDRLLAVYGATTKLANRSEADTSPNAGDKDDLLAAYAARRDTKTGTPLGPYRKIKGALLVAKAAAAGGEKCRADLDAALGVYFREWERASYLTALFSLNAAATSASANPVKGADALRAFGEALGFLQSFKGIPQDRRLITDAQIDKLLQVVGFATPYQLLTRTSARMVAFNSGYQEIGAVYGLTQTEIEDAKKAY